jgi:hypothetical protein
VKDKAKKYFPVFAGPIDRAIKVKYAKEITFWRIEADVMKAVFFAIDWLIVCRIVRQKLVINKKNKLRIKAEFGSK